MKKQKFNNYIPFFSLFFLFILIITTTQKVGAQEEPNGSKLSKYELSIDLVPIIDQGQFGKVYLKKYRYKEEQQKGAYRVGVSKGTYWFDKMDLSDLPDNVNISRNKTSNFQVDLYLGYEVYKQIGFVQTYFGLDLIGRYFKRINTPHYTDDQRNMTFGVCPFWGVKHNVYKNISFAFEIGWENSIDSFKNLFPSDGQKENSYNSNLQLPYNLTLNYNF